MVTPDPTDTVLDVPTPPSSPSTKKWYQRTLTELVTERRTTNRQAVDTTLEQDQTTPPLASEPSSARPPRVAWRVLRPSLFAREKWRTTTVPSFLDEAGHVVPPADLPVPTAPTTPPTPPLAPPPPPRSKDHESTDALVNAESLDASTNAPIDDSSSDAASFDESPSLREIATHDDGTPAALVAERDATNDEDLDAPPPSVDELSRRLTRLRQRHDAHLAKIARQQEENERKERERALAREEQQIRAQEKAAERRREREEAAQHRAERRAAAEEKKRERDEQRRAEKEARERARREAKEEAQRILDEARERARQSDEESRLYVQETAEQLRAARQSTKEEIKNAAKDARQAARQRRQAERLSRLEKSRDVPPPGDENDEAVEETLALESPEASDERPSATSASAPSARQQLREERLRLRREVRDAERLARQHRAAQKKAERLGRNESRGNRRRLAQLQKEEERKRATDARLAALRQRAADEQERTELALGITAALSERDEKRQLRDEKRMERRAKRAGLTSAASSQAPAAASRTTHVVNYRSYDLPEDIPDRP